MIYNCVGRNCTRFFISESGSPYCKSPDGKSYSQKFANCLTALESSFQLQLDMTNHLKDISNNLKDIKDLLVKNNDECREPFPWMKQFD